MIRGKKRNPIERYIKQKKDYGWQLKSENSENIIFEKEEPNGKYFQTFMKNELSFSSIFVIMYLIFIKSINLNYNVDFYYTVTSYWKIFMLCFANLFIIIFLIICIGEINYLFKHRVSIQGDKSEYIIPIKLVKRKMKCEKVVSITLLSLFIIGLSITIGANVLSKDKVPNVNLNLNLTELNDKIEGEIDNSLDVRKTIFAEDIYLKQIVYHPIDKKYYTDRLVKGRLDIEYFFSDNKWVLNKSFDSIYNELNEYSLYKEDNNSQELKNWGAKKLFIGENKERIILYEDRVLAIDGDFDYTKENIDKILKACNELKK
ncbi:hypothetical protein [Terrisporobacter mayombei]|uniref:DUF4367 domain-containing protein n=1 Tax=Terrisporobacter mayombei TaxID=1541 RepID=A0ABY9PZU2_9FIRM|nr:hypothetical protein [Terrisporobacter mayombei]MCC3866657.1 hypothetical protein [Terrisporobacter mayombei]WMT80894.1 hypothetical protein TEMA_12170 [Terrisporobacter mayombei]